ncbi:ABC transporter permease [Rubrobacter radiotolerans]|uniref:Iron ABC transporter permease n=1 Tax=Rubrobacter radiotolerans TaxID=42256 RepID=A0AB35T1X0_RUBRA|nr:iron ABC transporter permease [Rubrobacter radiotolerans]MDX5893854.1 iron ABC transporter permease [Rubrobacter radiotolerans]SMC04625.1 iron(III) transport system permease protein [Rubrobacter radiotolerans DSM 5868]
MAAGGISERVLGRYAGRGREAGGGRRPRPPVFVWAPALLVSLGLLLPPAYLLVRSLDGGLLDFWEVVSEANTLLVLGRSVLLAATVTLAAVSVAVPLAWLTVRTDLPARRLWAVLGALPLVIPSYVGGFVLISALGPRGMLQGSLERFGVERLPEIYGFPGAALALTLFTYPYVFLTVRSALKNLDPAMEEASRILGVGAFRTFFRVTLPNLRPAIVAGALLVTLYTLSDFGVVSLLQYNTFSREIYIQYRSAFDRTPAAILGLMLVCLTATILFVEGRTRGRAAYHRSAAGAARRAGTVALGAWRWPALGFCFGLVSLALFVPIGVLVFWLVRGVLAGEALNPLWQAALNSAYVSALAALATAACALPVAVLAVRYRGRMSSAVEKLSYLGYALPGIALALSLVFFGANYAPWAYQTLWLLVFAYVINFLPQALGATRSGLLQVKPSVEEAARGLGKGPLRVLAGVTAPLASPGILAGGALVFLTTMKELPATLLLSPTGYETLAMRVWSATSEAFFARAAAPALLLILISALPMYLLTIREPEGGEKKGEGP